MSIAAFTSMFLGGLVACYWVGLKFGVAVRVIKNLGASA